MTFELRLALRHLLSNPSQTGLVVAGVAVAVTLVIFVSSLIYGVQRRIVADTTGSLPMVTVEVAQRDAQPPRRLPEAGPAPLVAADQRVRSLARDSIDDWRGVERLLTTYPHVTAVSPRVTGQALIIHGGREAGVRVVGSVPEIEDRITGVSRDVFQGRYLGLSGQEVVIGAKLAQNLGAELNDRVRLVAGAGSDATYRVVGLLLSGQQAVDEQTAYLPLRSAQSLLGRGTAVTSFALRLDDLFAANDVADAIGSSLGLEAKSWMRENSRITDALRAQSGSSLMISTFSLLAAGFAIASVMIVSVVKRAPEVGILKSMGAQSDQILRVFTLEGISIGLLGAALGSLSGTALSLALGSIQQPSVNPLQPPRALFPVSIEPRLLVVTIVAALLISVLASVLPARQAARLDPVEVLRRG